MISMILGPAGTLWKLISGSLGGRLMAAALALFGAWQINNYVVRQKAVAKVVEKSKTEGRKFNAKNKTLRAKALSTPGSASRLPCRDC